MYVNNIDNTWIGIYDKNGYNIDSSTNIKSVIGYNREDILGKSAYEYTHPLDIKNILNSHLNVNDMSKLFLATSSVQNPMLFYCRPVVKGIK